MFISELGSVQSNLYSLFSFLLIYKIAKYSLDRICQNGSFRGDQLISRLHLFKLGLFIIPIHYICQHLIPNRNKVCRALLSNVSLQG